MFGLTAIEIVALGGAGYFLWRVTRGRRQPGCAHRGGGVFGKLLFAGLVVGGLIFATRSTRGPRHVVVFPHGHVVPGQDVRAEFRHGDSREMNEYRQRVTRRARAVIEERTPAPRRVDPTEVEAPEPAVRAKPKLSPELARAIREAKAPAAPRPPAAPTPAVPAEAPVAAKAAVAPEAPAKPAPPVITVKHGGVKLDVELDDAELPSARDVYHAVADVAREVAREVARQKVAQARESRAASAEAPAQPVRVPAAATPATPVPPSTSGRPEWLDQPAGKQGRTYTEHLVVGPFKTRPEADRELAIESEAATKRFIDRYLGEGSSDFVNIPMPVIHENIIADTWEEPIDHPEFGEMLNLHAQLKYDEHVCHQLRQRWRDSQIRDRLENVGWSVGGFFAILGTVFGYLKLDTLTRGYYTGRLRFAAGGAILAIVTVLVSLFS